MSGLHPSNRQETWTDGVNRWTASSKRTKSSPSGRPPGEKTARWFTSLVSGRRALTRTTSPFTIPTIAQGNIKETANSDGRRRAARTPSTATCTAVLGAALLLIYRCGLGTVRTVSLILQSSICLCINQCSIMTISHNVVPIFSQNCPSRA